MPLTVAKTAGFCFGVRRAVDTVYEQLERIPSTSSPKLFTLGEIIHNAQVVEELDSLGAVAVDSLEKLLELEEQLSQQNRPYIPVIIRSHGVSKKVYEALDSQSIPYIDATCPNVKRIQKIVEEQPEGTLVLIAGDAVHPEIQGIIGHCNVTCVTFTSAKELAAQGVKELILVAQETTLYGVDLYGEKTLPKLLHELCKIEEIQWIRLMYCYPEEITDELIDTIAEEEKVCHYLDIPIQHSEDPVLRRMGRRTCKKDIVELIAKLRIRIPDIAIRTTLIAGFPGETEADHEALMEFVNESEFDRLGVFTYSPEEGTPAASFPNQIENEVAEKWRDDIMALQQEVSYDKNQELLGKSLTVLIEGYVAEDDVYVGRTYRDAPDVDGMVFVDAPYELMSGTFVQVRITDANEYDLTGEMIE